ncbi:aldose 1-epimerase [Kordia periserrulae]|uniref:Aldose 1-epimerase n=1 Tax=Kordia periserrulae TaxID=701523 RepID=A0A2T6BZY5_9FLAO|nr:aldose 1-epimerase [Kordia periserrulae]PTX61616.1 aldose 1-epimerase [Kordia periserrulae]
MFQIEENKQTIIISNKSNSVNAQIIPNEGGRLADVKLNDRTIIAEQPQFPYSQSSASAIMFPFVNRIEDGTYTFEGKTYQIACNEPAKNNAIHGLLYTRKFEVYSTDVSETSASVTLQYTYDGTTKGFPFPFDFYVTYKFTETTLDVIMKVTNTGTQNFPFTIGWHPYFVAENLYESTLNFDCETEYTTTLDRSLTNGTTKHTLSKPFQIQNTEFDTAFKLKNPAIEFTTANYKATIKGSATENFVQFFTPSTKNIIAIEPTVGLSNSFNNGIGLQTLEAGKIYEIAWNVAVAKL